MDHPDGAGSDRHAQGNYVQGTVLLVLRKRTETEPVFLDEITHEVEVEVRRQLDSMLALEDDSDPNFGDADYQLAAYAAALRVLTARPIEELDPARELLRERPRGEVGPVEALIRSAVKIACDHLVPHGIERDLWRDLGPSERLYLKGLEVESHGEYRSGVYQELARGFGAADYTDLLASTRANETAAQERERIRPEQALRRRLRRHAAAPGALRRGPDRQGRGDPRRPGLAQDRAARLLGQPRQGHPPAGLPGRPALRRLDGAVGEGCRGRGAAGGRGAE